MNLLNRDTDSNKDVTGRIVAILDESMRGMHQGAIAGQAMVAMESLSDTGRKAINESTDFIAGQLNVMRSVLAIESDLLPSQVDAATQAGIMAQNWQGFQRLKPRDGLPRDVAMHEVVTMESFNLPDVVTDRSYATESYDNTDNRTDDHAKQHECRHVITWLHQ